MYSNKKHIFVISEILMKQLLLFGFLCCFSAQIVLAQTRVGNDRQGPKGEESEGGGITRKFSAPREKQKRAPKDSYKIISVERDTTYVDTSLSIHKEYKFNYLRRDEFELENAVNIGATYTQLAKQKIRFNAVPHFGASARHLGYFEAEDINYYQVPTPFTELFYKTALEQGQQLDAFVTINTSPNLNFSVAYKGVRSLGAYQNSLTSTKSFRGTVSYSTPNKRYVANAHFTDQRLLNQENGGLDENAVNGFQEIADESDDRAILTVNFENANNLLDGKRYFLNHEYRISEPDSLGNGRLSVGHEIEYTRKKYYFEQSGTEEGFFGTAQSEDEFLDRVEFHLLQNKAFVSYKNKYLGKLGFFARHTFFNYGYDNIIVDPVFAIDALGSETTEIIGYNKSVTNRIIDETISLGANYKNTYKGFLLEGNLESVISGPFSNQYFLGTAGYNYKDKFDIKFGYEFRSEAQSFNKLLYQSNYTEYSWQYDFDNTLTNTFIVDITKGKDFSINASYSIIDKYAYFERNVAEAEEDDEDDGDLDEDGNVIARVSNPTQTNGTISLLKIKAFKEFSLGNFRLANTLMFQQVDGNAADTYNVPKFVTRNSLYYQNMVFRKAMYLQTGFNFKYFTKYNADGYDPLLADYYVQNSIEIGGYPQVDFFLNAKVRQTRIFFKLENMHGLLSQNNDLVAPNYPSRDFLIRFGLVWNFFL